MSLTCHKITWHLNSLIAWPFFEMPRSQTKKKGENICKVPGTAHDIETIKVENLLFKKNRYIRNIYESSYHTTVKSSL